jgi:hypothetical protein
MPKYFSEVSRNELCSKIAENPEYFMCIDRELSSEKKFNLSAINANVLVFQYLNGKM